MAIEIERKYLVRDTSVVTGLIGTRIIQGYLTCSSMVVRIRVAGGKAFLTLKSNGGGLTRTEFEYEVPLADAEELLSTFCLLGSVEKIRYSILVGDLTFDIDVFQQELLGLVVAEVELPSEDHPVPELSWLGSEVSRDPRYRNSALAASRLLPIRAFATLEKLLASDRRQAIGAASRRPKLITITCLRVQHINHLRSPRGPPCPGTFTTHRSL